MNLKAINKIAPLISYINKDDRISLAMLISADTSVEALHDLTYEIEDSSGLALEASMTSPMASQDVHLFEMTFA
jgi:hypothetical protein